MGPPCYSHLFVTIFDLIWIYVNILCFYKYLIIYIVTNIHSYQKQFIPSSHTHTNIESHIKNVSFRYHSDSTYKPNIYLSTTTKNWTLVPSYGINQDTVWKIEILLFRPKGFKYFKKFTNYVSICLRIFCQMDQFVADGFQMIAVAGDVFRSRS